MYIVVFNGPPRVGKDTASSLFCKHMLDQLHVPPPIKEESLSLPLREIAYKMVGLNYVDGERVKDVPVYDEFKKANFDLLGRTGRELMIDISERFLKPVYGQEVMARLLMERNESFRQFDPSIMLIRDVGFPVELDELCRWVGFNRVMVVRLWRKGCSFDGDSRRSVFHPIQTLNMSIDNSGSLRDLATEMGRLYGRLVNQCGWKF